MKTCLYSVYRDADGYDCSNNGVTSRHSSVRLFFDCTKEEAMEHIRKYNIDPDKCLYLVKRNLWGEDHSYAEPMIYPEGKNCGMFGGNFIYTSNGLGYHFEHTPYTTSPIQVHDRFE